MDDVEQVESPTTTVINRMPSPPGALYGLGVIGAWVWFWRAADGFGEHAWAIVQGAFWPAYLVYDAFRALRG